MSEPRRLVIFIDGTWARDSNVTRFWSAIKEDSTALRFYELGLGGAVMRSFSVRRVILFILKWLSGATGLFISVQINESYRFLSDKYEEGAEIFLIGFSRGAYAVRSLAGLIHRCGLVRAEHADMVSEATRLYKRGTLEQMGEFKRRYSYPTTPIKMIGVWDTVAALGLPINWLNRFNPLHSAHHDVGAHTELEYGYHALAIDEQRKAFRPELWSEGEIEGSPHLEEVWFAGAHTDIGGGYHDDRGLAEIALYWMLQKAEALGLDFDPEKIAALKPRYDGKIHDSRKGLRKAFVKHVRVIEPSKSTFISCTVEQRMEAPAQPAYAPENVAGQPGLQETYSVVNQEYFAKGY